MSLPPSPSSAPGSKPRKFVRQVTEDPPTFHDAVVGMIFRYFIYLLAACRPLLVCSIQPSLLEIYTIYMYFFGIPHFYVLVLCLTCLYEVLSLNCSVVDPHHFDVDPDRGDFRGVARPPSPPPERFRGWRSPTLPNCSVICLIYFTVLN